MGILQKKCRTTGKKALAYRGKPCPSFPCLLGFYTGKPPNLPRIFCPCRNHKIPGKERKNTNFSKEFPCLKFTKEIQTSKERKDREGGQNTGTAFPALRLRVVRYLLKSGAGTCGIWGQSRQRPLHETMRLAEARLVRHAPGGSMPS